MARLYAKCNVPTTHVQGKLGWSLSYQDPTQQDYERYSYTKQFNTSRAILTVYSTSDTIPGTSYNYNTSHATSFKYIYSSKGQSDATQSCLGLFNNININDTRLNNIYNASTNTNLSEGRNDSLIYIEGQSTTNNINLSRIKNRSYKIGPSNSVKVAIGNDADIYGVCYFDRAGLFPPGIYVLDIQRFSPDTGVPLKTNRNVWIINTAQKELTCGTYLDIYNEINLK